MEESFSILSRVLGGNGSLTIVSGSAGIGKTRFVEEFKKAAERTGCEVLTGRCMFGAAVPYLPFIEAFSSQTDQNPFEFRQIGATDAFTSSPKYVLFPALDILSRLSSQDPLIIHIEDIHWADSSTITLLHFLARSIKGMRVLIIATSRTEELWKGSEADRDFVLETIRTMRRERLFHEIELKPLDSEELAQIARSVLGDELDSRSLKSLQKASDGNPLFFLEALNLLESRGSLLKKEGKWHLRKETMIEIPPTVQEILLRRFESLSKDQKRTLELASVTGEWFDIELMTNAFDLDRIQLVGSMDSLLRDSGLIEVTSGQYHFKHQLVQRAIYENVSLPFRKELHRLLGETIETTKNIHDMFSVLADHFTGSGDEKKSLQYCMLAGEGFLKRYAYNEAFYYLTIAESWLHHNSDKEIEIRILEALGDVNQNIGQDGIADEYYQKCLSNIDLLSQNKARLLRKRAECWLPMALGKGDSSKFFEFLNESENCPLFNPTDRAEIEFLRGFHSFIKNDLKDSKVHYATASKIFRKIDKIDRLIVCLVEEIEILLSEGDVKGALDQLREIDRLKYTERWGPLQLMVDFAYGTAKLHTGKLEEALQSYTECLKRSEEIMDYPMIIIANQYIALVFEEMGDHESAERSINKTMIHYEIDRIPILESRSHAYLAHFQLLRGQKNEAKRSISEAYGSIEEFSSPLNITSGIVKLVEAELLVALRHEDLGQSQFSTALELLRNGVYGILFETMGLMWYAGTLRRHGNYHESNELLHRAFRNYDQLGNKSGMDRIKDMLVDRQYNI